MSSVVSLRRALGPELSAATKADELYETFVPVLQCLKRESIDPEAGQFRIVFERGSDFQPTVLVEFRPLPEVADGVRPD